MSDRAKPRCHTLTGPPGEALDDPEPGQEAASSSRQDCFKRTQQEEETNRDRKKTPAPAAGRPHTRVTFPHGRKEAHLPGGFSLPSSSVCQESRLGEHKEIPSGLPRCPRRPAGAPSERPRQEQVPKAFRAWSKAMVERAGPKGHQERMGGTGGKGSTRSQGGRRPKRPGSPQSVSDHRPSRPGRSCCVSWLRWGAERSQHWQLASQKPEPKPEPEPGPGLIPFQSARSPRTLTSNSRY